jgi:transglutaminase-like putative cysteine protease
MHTPARQALHPTLSSFPPPPVAFWLLAGIVLVLAPHTLHLPLWLSVVSLGMLAWRWAAAIGKLPLPGKWLLVLLAITATAGILLQYRTLFGRDAGVAMLALMVSLKLLEVRSYRDATLAIFLGYFLVVTNFFYTQSIPVGAYLIGVVLVLTLALITLNHPSSAKRWRQPLKLAALFVLQATPLMLMLFLLFPRIAGPLWGLPTDAFAGVTGLSDRMAPGSISQLAQSDAVAFRAEFTGPLPPPTERYWRGPVLGYFGGREWSRVRGVAEPRPAIEATTPAVRYTLTQEASNKNWIFALDVADPQMLPPNTRLTPDLQLLAREPVQRRTRYVLTSFLNPKVGRVTDAAVLKRDLQLPARGNPAARDLAKRMRGTAASDAQFVQAVLRMFHEQPFVYTLTPPLLGNDGIDEFLFSTRRGFCEHYAGAFTFLMRAAGVPARVVTGYQGGEFNSIGNYLIVRQSDAHAWSEVWLQGQGWVRIDPTAAVAANRIESGIAAALPEGEPLPFLVRTDAEWLRQLELRWDAINNDWNQWVLGYNQELQISLFAGLGLGIVSWRELAWGLVIGIGTLLGIIALITLRASGKPPGDEVQALYLKFCAKLARKGLVRRTNEGPLDFAARVQSLRPEVSSVVDPVTRLYIQLRYGARATKETLRQFRSLIRSFQS